jgi:hypothetical protein
MRNSELDETKKLIGALLRQPPKLHDEMKLGKPRAKAAKSLVLNEQSAKLKKPSLPTSVNRSKKP